MRVLTIAAAALLIAGAAFAQTAVQNPSEPGSGYKVPETTTTTSQAPFGVPPQGADPAHPQPGEGYKIQGGKSPTAPAEPVGAVTRHGKEQQQ